MPAPYAPWWRRAVAYLLDAIFLGIMALPLGVIIFLVAIGMMGAVNDADDMGAYLGIMLLAMAFFFVCYAALAVWYYGRLARSGEQNGQTWGKQVMEVRVVRLDERPVSWGTVWIREILLRSFVFYLLPYGLILGLTWALVAGADLDPDASSLLFNLSQLAAYVPLLLVYLWPLWDKRQQTPYDKLAKTVVLHTPKVVYPGGPYQQQPGPYQQQPGPYQQQPGPYQQPESYQQQPGPYQQPGPETPPEPPR